jgi:tetratricopeptide (TPR) repeat protein
VTDFVRNGKATPFYKTVVWLMKSGNKELGIKQLGMAAQQSLFSKAESGFYLGHILLDYEKKPQAALPVLQKTAATYPDNLFLNAKYADALLVANRPAQALPIIDRLQASIDPVYRLFGQLYQARYDLQVGKLTEAQSGATAVLKVNPTDETLLAWANVVLARISHRQGQTNQARTYYKKAIDLSEYPLLRDEANAYLDSH